MHVDEKQIYALSKELWATNLGLNLEQINGNGATQSENTHSSCIKLSGDWNGALMLECPDSILRHAAVMLFDGTNDDPAEDDIEDALKELSEMVGKKLRGLLPETTKLSRPSLVQTCDDSEAPIEIQQRHELNLSCEGRPVKIVLLEGEAAAVQTA